MTADAPPPEYPRLTFGQMRSLLGAITAGKMRRWLYDHPGHHLIVWVEGEQHGATVVGLDSTAKTDADYAQAAPPAQKAVGVYRITRGKAQTGSRTAKAVALVLAGKSTYAAAAAVGLTRQAVQNALKREHPATCPTCGQRLPNR